MLGVSDTGQSAASDKRERAARHLQRTVEEAAERQAMMDEAVRSRDWAIVEAARAGMSLSQIAEQTGMSRSRVGDITRAMLGPRHNRGPRG